jgi:hypothetical protein
MRLALAVCLLICAFAVTSQASSITFMTPTGSTIGGQPVNASATFVTSANTLTVTLTDLLANPTDVGQLLSDLFFTLSNGSTAGTLTSSSGQEITVNSGGTFTLGGTVSTGWALSPSGGSLLLNVLGTPVGPAHLIIGPSGGATYSNANGSIAGNGPHNPFLNQTATFTITDGTITAATTVTAATFSFGTTAGSNVVGVPTTTPEPTTLVSLGGALLLLGALGRMRKRPASTQKIKNKNRTLLS